MALMNKNKFCSKFFPCTSILSLTTEFEDNVVDVEVFRGSTTRTLSKQNGIILNPTFLWISRDLMNTFRDKDTLMEWLLDLNNPFFQKKSKFRNEFDSYEVEMELVKYDWKFDGKISDYMIRMDIPPLVYFRFLNKNDKGLSRFYPRMSEKVVYRNLLNDMDRLSFPNGFMTLENIDEMINKVEDLFVNLKHFYEISYLRKSKYQEVEEMMTMIDTKTYYEAEMKYSLNMKNIKTWMKARHNLFGVSLLQEMNWEIPDKFDVDLIESLSYTGLFSHKTPDFFYWEEDKLVLVDFAVTDRKSVV